MEKRFHHDLKWYFTLHPWAEMMRRSAGILSPPLTSTRSPITTSSALILFFSPSRITKACYGQSGNSLNATKENKKILIIWKDYCQYLRDKVLERVHDLGALGLLIVWETSSDHHNSREHNTQIQLHRKTEETLGVLLEQRYLKRHTLKKHKQGFLLTLSLAGSSSEAAWMP